MGCFLWLTFWRNTRCHSKWLLRDFVSKVASGFTIINVKFSIRVKNEHKHSLSDAIKRTQAFIFRCNIMLQSVFWAILILMLSNNSLILQENKTRLALTFSNTVDGGVTPVVSLGAGVQSTNLVRHPISSIYQWPHSNFQWWHQWRNKLLNLPTSKVNLT